MENFVLLLMPACGTYKYLSVYMCSRLEKQALEIARLVMMKKTTADSKSNVKNTLYTCDLHGQ